VAGLLTVPLARPQISGSARRPSVGGVARSETGHSCNVQIGKLNLQSLYSIRLSNGAWSSVDAQGKPALGGDRRLRPIERGLMAAGVRRVKIGWKFR